MSEFFQAVTQYNFMLYALLTGLLASIASGIVGTYVVVRRLNYIAGGIAHSVLGGMGLARYLAVQYQWDWLNPLYGAVLAALVAAVLIGLAGLYLKEREDTVIGAIWALGMAVGIVFISLTPGYNEDLMSYLFGNILMVSSSELWLLVFLDVLIIAIVAAFRRQLAAVCFDEGFARVRGIRVELYFMLLLLLTALTVVIMTTVVGLIMVIALLSLPAAIAGFFTMRINVMFVLATILSIIFVVVGLAISYSPNLPAGATIIILAGFTYLVVLLVSSLRKRRLT